MFSDTEDYKPRFTPRRGADNTTNMKQFHRHSLIILRPTMNSKLISLSVGIPILWNGAMVNENDPTQRLFDDYTKDK